MSSGTRILLIRHATTAKVGKALSGWLPGIPLDEPGRVQAEGLVNRLRDTPIHRIYASPIQRAQETAQPLALNRGLEVLESKGMGEVNFGEWQGKYLHELSDDPAFQLFNSYRSGTRAPGGELMVETQARVVAALSDIAGRHPGETVAVFSHADAIKTAVMYTLGIPMDFHHRLEIETTSVTTLDFYRDIVRVIRLNNLS